MKIAAVQHDIVWEDGASTRAQLVPLVRQAAMSGARLIVLSEMYATGFSMRPQQIAEEQGGPSERFLIEQAIEHDVWIIGSIAQWPESTESESTESESTESESTESESTESESTESESTESTKVPTENRRALNVAVLAGPNGQLHRYVKIHPFSYSGEDKHYLPGAAFLTVSIDDLRVSVFICYDLRFADEFWQLAPDTDLYVVVANWPERRREHWSALLRARAIENQAYVLGCNRVGTGDGISYLGDSAIIDPLGRTLVEASRGEAVIAAVADPGEVARIRQRFPFLADRRTGAAERSVTSAERSPTSAERSATSAERSPAMAAVPGPTKRV